RAATADTPFLLASLSKAWVGVAVARLLQDGAITLDDPIAPVVGFPIGAPRDAAITWRGLVTHTSGIRDDWDVMDRHYARGDSDEELGAFLRAYLDPDGAEYRPGHVQVGGREVYSNIGAALAAYAVERAVDQPFDAWCEDHLFAPLGLADTHWHLADFPADTVALPYTRRRGELVTDGHYGFPDYPDGQLRSSARDVATFLAAIAGGGPLLSADGVAALLRPPRPDVDPLQGVLWYAEARGGVEVWGHNGGEVGASTDAFFDPATGAGFVLLVNGEPPARPMNDLEAWMLTAE
ncbi:MAG TPA: serine hydrolase domain-containing protein, partial [Myxococcota bacterium]|nr:serine hydrolase domain-containing protein [Myxococcota bacterium]